jgi:hypothetical protein
MVKNYRIVSMSLGVETIEKAQDVLEKYSKWKRSKLFKNASATEVYEMAIRIGLPVIEKMLDDKVMEFTDGSPTFPDERVLASAVQKKTSQTLADLTDEEIEALEKGE